MGINKLKQEKNYISISRCRRLHLKVRSNYPGAIGIKIDFSDLLMISNGEIVLENLLLQKLKLKQKVIRLGRHKTTKTLEFKEN